jgi:asparagine synthase (glutamine-hydrolysing)
VFAFGLVAGFRDGARHADRLPAVMAAHPAGGADGARTAAAPHATATVLRWVVVGRDETAGPSWDAARGLLFAGDVRLYNRPELIAELGEPPAALHACSDLDLARLAYLKWGPASPSRLVGDFAFAAWEERERTLFAARDHFGMRPLHFHRLVDGVAVASDVRQLLAFVGDPGRELSGAQILDGLLRRPTDLRRTYFRTIERVPPGAAVVLTDGKIERRRYWMPPDASETNRSYADHCEQLRHVFKRAVRDRLESDRPIIVHASGGFDSSTIVMAADEIYRSEPQRPPLTLASAVAPGFPSDESRYIDAVAAHVSFAGERWNVIPQAAPRFPGVLGAAPILRHGLAGGPRRDLELAQERGARVLISGLLGDGVWHATGVLRDMVRHGRWLQAAHEILRRGLPGAYSRTVDAGLGLLPPALAVRAARRLTGSRPPPPEWLGPELRSLYAHTRGPELDVAWPGSSHLQLVAWTRLAGPGVGRLVAAFVDYAADEGVELRAPYADVRLVEAVLRIPWRQREPRGHYRRTGRDALGPMLPPEFAQRFGQQSWSDVWAANARRTTLTIAPLIQAGPWRSAPYVDRGIARAMLQDVLAGRDRDRPQVPMLVADFGALEAWLRQLFG